MVAMLVAVSDKVRKMKTYCRLFFLVLALLIGLFPLARTMSSTMVIANTSRDVIAVPFFSQTALKDAIDNSGNPYYLGHSKILLWTDGCGVASLAMVFQKWGVDTCVQCLNEKLKETGGLSGALLNFQRNPKGIAAAEITAAGSPFIKGIRSLSTSRPAEHKEEVNDELAAGRPVIAFINNAHFVVITGKDQAGRYLVNDPWKPNSNEGANILIENNLTGKGFDYIRKFVFVYPQDYAPTNSIAVKGKILQAYLMSGGSVGLFGNPVTEDTYDNRLNGIYPYQEFENGAVIEMDTQARWVSGPLWKKIKSLGGYLKTGLPRSGEYSYWSGGRVAHTIDLQNMTLRWNDDQPEGQVEILAPGDAIRVEYFSNPTLSGLPTYTGLASRINHNWKTGYPIPWLEVPDFSVRWTAKMHVSTPIGWFYTFLASGEGRYRVSIDGNPILDAWDKHSGTKVIRFVSNGDHTVVLEYAKNDENANISMAWSAWPTTPVFAAEGDADGPIEYPSASVTSFLGQPDQPTATPSSEIGRIYTTPDQPVRTLFAALAARDADLAISTLVPTSRIAGKLLARVVLTAVDQRAAGSRLEFTEIDYQVNTISADHAIVTVDGIGKFYNSAGELTDSEYFAVDIPVAKVDRGWFVSADVSSLIDQIKPFITEK
jgi:hypothetical protein